MNRTPLEIHEEDLVHAPWNPRAAITPADVADLTESIKKDGLIQRLAVIADKDAGHYVVIAGNRRLVACRAAGLAFIPCELLDVDIQTAKRMTLIENLQRKDVDPLMEADLIHGLTTDGMTISEIATETGRGDKWVWRRQQLVHLNKVWRDLVSKGINFTVDCLERVASYPESVQVEAVKAVPMESFQGQVKWSNIDREFDRLCRELDSAEFSRKACERCPNNSANAPMLFDLEPAQNGKRRRFGTCLCGDCFERKVEEHVEDVRVWAIAHGHEVVTVKDLYAIYQYWNRSEKPTDENKVLYLFRDYSGRSCMAWGKPKPKDPEVDAEKVRQEQEQKKLVKMRREVCAKMSGWMDKNRDRFREIVSESFARAIRNSSSVTQYHALALCQAFLNEYFDADASAEKMAEVVVKQGSGDMSPEQMDGFSDKLGSDLMCALESYECEDYARKILDVFPEMREAVPTEDIETLINK